MNCHELQKTNTLIFWGQKCGATCIKEMIMHIESGSWFSNGGRDHITHNIYEQFYKKSSDLSDSSKYLNHNVIFFGRNPYSRIISLFLDKYVSLDSPTPNENASADTFSNFITFLNKNQGDFKKLKQVVFSGFFPITSTPEYSLFEFLIKNTKGNISLNILDEFLLPDGKLMYKPGVISDVYSLVEKQELYKNIAAIYSKKWTSKQNKIEELVASSSSFLSNISDLEHADKSSLRAILKQKAVNTSNFFSVDLIEKFNEFYKDEISFYRQLNFSLTL